MPATYAPRRTVRRRPHIPSPPPPQSSPESPDSFDAETISAGPSSPTATMERDYESDGEEREDDEEEFEDEDEEEEGGEEGEFEDDEEEFEEEDDDVSTTTTPAAPTASASLVGLKEIGNLASWTCSTAKPGNGIAQLRDLDTSQFWQSDGPQPHHINIHFAKRVKVNRIRMFLDFENDESYTPTKMVIMSGTGYQDLCEVAKLDLERPTGWIDVDLTGVHDDGELRTHLIQLRILANHQNGKDTHVRGLQVYAKEEFVPPYSKFPIDSMNFLGPIDDDDDNNDGLIR